MELRQASINSSNKSVKDAQAEPDLTLSRKAYRSVDSHSIQKHSTLQHDLQLHTSSSVEGTLEDAKLLRMIIAFIKLHNSLFGRWSDGCPHFSSYGLHLLCRTLHGYPELSLEYLLSNPLSAHATPLCSHLHSEPPMHQNENFLMPLPSSP